MKDIKHTDPRLDRLEAALVRAQAAVDKAQREYLALPPNRRAGALLAWHDAERARNRAMRALRKAGAA